MSKLYKIVKRYSDNELHSYVERGKYSVEYIPNQFVRPSLKNSKLYILHRKDFIVLGDKHKHEDRLSHVEELWECECEGVSYEQKYLPISIFSGISKMEFWENPENPHILCGNRVHSWSDKFAVCDAVKLTKFVGYIKDINMNM